MFRKQAEQLAKDDIANGTITKEQYKTAVESYIKWLESQRTAQIHASE